MRFCLLDRISSLEPHAALTAMKNVCLSEEYLADHFPEFPVLPGVFMLEAATQAGAWLIRMSEDYSHSIIVLHETRAVKYADFVTPGHSLSMTVEQTKQDERYTSMRFEGRVEGRLSVNGRIVLERYNLADENPELARLDARMLEHQRSMGAMLTQGMHVAAATS